MSSAAVLTTNVNINNTKAARSKTREWLVLTSASGTSTAIFAANDEMAFGVMNVAAEMGLKIPGDLSLVGFDGTSFSTFVVPSLSTIIRQTDEMSRLGTQKLLVQIDEGPDAARGYETMVSSLFIPRESTGPAPVG